MEPIEDGESYETDGGHPYWGQPGKPHVNPGCDVTVDPRQPIDDSFRERNMKQKPLLVFLVAIADVDSHQNRYICDTEEMARELFDELRKECIAECNESIEYFKKERMEYSIPHEREKINFLTNMKPGDVPPWCCDHPTVEVFPFITTNKDSERRAGERK